MVSIEFGSEGPVFSREKIGVVCIDLPVCVLGLTISTFTCVDIVIWWRSKLDPASSLTSLVLRIYKSTKSDRMLVNILHDKFEYGCHRNLLCPP